MNKTLKVYCPLCGADITEKTTTQIIQHMEEIHKVTLIDAASNLLAEIFQNQEEHDN